MRRSELSYCSKVGRCAGRNPPSVLGGIRLYGLPAPPAGGIGAYSPFHPAGRPSQPFARASSTLTGSHRLHGEVTFLSVADALAPRLTAPQPCTVDGVSSDLTARRPPTGSPTKGEEAGEKYKGYSLRSTFPGSAPVCFESLTTKAPLTMTCSIPSGYRRGSSWSPLSVTVFGSKTTISA